MLLDAWQTENYLKNLADMQTQIKELVPDSLKENGERKMTKDETIPIGYIEEQINEYKLADQWDYAWALDMLVANWKEERKEE